MRDNALQFAVVREDPSLELALIDRFKLKSALLVCSGGCTALTIAAKRPAVELNVFDINPAQLDHLVDKAECTVYMDGAARDRVLNIGESEATAIEQHSHEHSSKPRAIDHWGLNERGNFESLFRGLRGVLHEFIATPAEIKEVLVGDRDASYLTKSRYWPVAFELFFSDAILVAMFGPDAIQHAPSGSYPSYFQRAIERGLSRPDRSSNRYLHHFLLGHYLPHAPPAYLGLAELPTITSHQAELAIAYETCPAEFVSLSNLFDWMNDDNSRSLAEDLTVLTEPGTCVLVRQLNNTRDLGALFGADWAPEPELAEQLHESDQSLFYNRLFIARRR